MFRAVLCDWGHTLFDTAGAVDFLDEWAGAHGYGTPRTELEAHYRAALVRSRRPEELAKGRDRDPRRHRACWLELWHELDLAAPGIAAALYERETSAAGWSPYADTPVFLDALAARGIPLVVVSDVAFDLRPIFGHHGLDHLVHHYVISGEHGTVKSEGELFRLALAAAGVAPHEAVMIGDNPANDGTAIHEGIATLLLPPVPSGHRRGLERALALLT